MERQRETVGLLKRGVGARTARDVADVIARAPVRRRVIRGRTMQIGVREGNRI